MTRNLKEAAGKTLVRRTEISYKAVISGREGHVLQSLMSRVARKVKDKRVLHLIRSYLRAGLFEGGIITQRVEGIP